MSTPDRLPPFAVVLPSPLATREFGRRLGAACRGGEVLLLNGPLGAGKTCLVQGLALGLDVAATTPVTSPTFVLHGQYFGRLELNHLDAYRLENTPDPRGLGFEELWGLPEAVAAVEWAEFLAPILPSARLELEFELVSAQVRRLTLTATDPAHARLLAAVGAAN